MSEASFESEMTVRLVSDSASDANVVWAAKVSTEGERSIESLEEDPAHFKGLINYLLKSKHGTPFEHSTFTFYVHAPIFVMRQLLRHRIMSPNEESGRYRVLETKFYVPDDDRKVVQVGKTGHYTFEYGTHKQKSMVQAGIRRVCTEAQIEYNKLIKAGISNEVARMVPPLSTYSSAYITINARSLMNVLSLRVEDRDAAFISHPQIEIEMVAKQMEKIFEEKMPITYESYIRNGRIAP